MKHYLKLCSLLLVLPALMAIYTPGDTTNKNMFSTTETYYGFNSSQDYSINVKNSGKGSVTIKTNIYNGENDGLVSTSTTYLVNSARSYSINLPFKNRLKAPGLRVEFVANLSKAESEYTISGMIYPYLKQSFNTKYFHQEPIEIKGTYLLIKDNIMYVDERFNFIDTLEYLSTDKYNAVCINEIKFLYDIGYDFSCEYIEYHIKDYQNVFPNLNKNNSEVVLKMKYLQNDNEISLDLDQALYVNQDTLEMSSSPLAGYGKTNKLYIPIGKEELFAENESYILLKNAGYSRSDFIIPFTFYFNKKYVGECYNSDFCISGGIKE